MRRSFIITSAVCGCLALLAGCATPRNKPPPTGLAVGYGPEDLILLPGRRLVASCGCLQGGNRVARDSRGLYCLNLPSSDHSPITTNWVVLKGRKTHGIAIFPGATSLLVSVKSDRGSEIWQVGTETPEPKLWARTDLPVNDLVITSNGTVYATTSLPRLWQAIFSVSTAKVLELRPNGPHREICSDVTFGAGIACWGDRLLVSSSLDGEVWLVDPLDGRRHVVASALGCTDNIMPNPGQEDVFFVAAMRNRWGLLIPRANAADVWRLTMRTDHGGPAVADVAQLETLPYPALVSCALPDGKGRMYFGRNIGNHVDDLLNPTFITRPKPQP